MERNRAIKWRNRAVKQIDIGPKRGRDRAIQPGDIGQSKGER